MEVWEWIKSGIGTAVSFTQITQITQIYCLATEATEIDFSVRLFHIFLFHFAVSFTQITQIY